MNNGPNKNYRAMYYIRSKNVHVNNTYENKLERKKGYVTIEISEINEKNFSCRKNKKKKNYELIFQGCQHMFPTCNIKNFTKKKIKNTWTKILLEKFHDTTNKINEKFNSIIKICIIKVNNFSTKLSKKKEKILRDSLKYLNIENEEVQLNYTNMQNFINISRVLPKKKLRDNCCRNFLQDSSEFNSKNFKKAYYEMSNTNTYTDGNFMKCKDLNGLFNKKLTHKNNICNNYIYSNEQASKFVSGNENFRSDLQNIRNFYVSIINKNTNTKKVRKISLMEICKNPYFFISQNFLSDLESYLALNHCLLYIKVKNQKEMSQIYHNFFSILINIDDINFLEENVSTSILRHIIKRLNSLFQIPTNGISSIEFCLYLKSIDKEDSVHFIEQNIYKYSILIFLNAKNENYIEFPKNGLRIMTIIGSCLVYECNKKSFDSNIFKFDISEEKIFFLKLNLKYDINLHRLFINEMNTNQYAEDFSKQNKLTELYGNILKNQNIFYGSQFIDNTYNKCNANNMHLMKNHYSYIKKNIESINEKIMELNMNYMKNLFLRSSKHLKNNEHYSTLQSHNLKQKQIFKKK
ncbi:conserved Plasmodium protein, unknown function [Plasmodium gallinaceum]|uniref:Uncharacterized protein n=1 Tax=Plasmodium gallinaceum TaxID=5849 RepID=A0A1J1GN69_PLAGA|nr:conserved Plasmodium protein, unknown function [Plasmodium gallinaceum]CRG93911.1 conserved Plasmodium protein, unknown function [Plasmodium gallinaceum]